MLSSKSSFLINVYEEGNGGYGGVPPFGRVEGATYGISVGNADGVGPAVDVAVGAVNTLGVPVGAKVLSATVGSAGVVAAVGGGGSSDV